MSAVRAAGHHGEDPGRQDRRGDRPEGPDDQRDPGRDRRRDHHRGRRHDLRRRHRRPVGRRPRSTGSTRSPTRRCPRSASGSSARWSRPPRSARSSRCCPAATAWCTSPSWATASGSARSRTSLNVGDKLAGRDRRHRRPRQDLAWTRSARGRRGAAGADGSAAGRRREAAAAAARGDRERRDRPAPAASGAPALRRRPPRQFQSRTSRQAGSRRPRRARRPGASAPSCPAGCGSSPRRCPATRGAPRHLGRRRLARRDPGAGRRRRTSSSTCCSRARRRRTRAGDLRRRSRRSAARPTPSPPRSTPATTRKSSTPTCRSRSTLLCDLVTEAVQHRGRPGDRARGDPRRDRHARRRARRRRARPVRRGALRRHPARPARSRAPWSRSSRLTRDDVDGCYRQPVHLPVDRGHRRRAASTTPQVVDLVDRRPSAHRLAGDARPGAAAARRTARRRAPARPRGLIHRRTEQTHLLLGGPAMGRLDERRFAAARAQHRRRRRHELAGCSRRSGRSAGWPTASAPALSHYAGAGAFSVYAGCAPEAVPRGAAADPGRARPGGRRRASPPRRWPAAGAAQGRRWCSGLEDTGSRMSRLGKSELSYGEYQPVREVLARLDAVDEDAGARGRRRAVRPGDLPGRRRARTASPTSTGSDGAAAFAGARPARPRAPSPSPSSCRSRCSSRRPPTSRPRRPGVDKIVHASLFAALALTGRWAGVAPRGPGAGCWCSTPPAARWCRA